MLKLPIIVEIIFFINPSSILTNEYKKKKFPNLNNKEINNYISRSLNINTKIEIKKISDDLFLLKNLKNKNGK